MVGLGSQREIAVRVDQVVFVQRGQVGQLYKRYYGSTPYLGRPYVLAGQPVSVKFSTFQ